MKKKTRQDKIKQLIEKYNIKKTDDYLHNMYLDDILETISSARMKNEDVEYLLKDNAKIAVRYSHLISSGIKISDIRKIEESNKEINRFDMAEDTPEVLGPIVEKQRQHVKKLTGNAVELYGRVKENGRTQIKKVKGIYLDYDVDSNRLHNSGHIIVDTNGDMIKVTWLNDIPKIKEINIDSSYMKMLYQIYNEYASQRAARENIRKLENQIEILRNDNDKSEQRIDSMKKELAYLNPDYVMSKSEFIDKVHELLDDAPHSIIDGTDYHLSAKPSPYIRFSMSDNNIYLYMQKYTYKSEFTEFNYEGELDFIPGIEETDIYRNFLKNFADRNATAFDIPYISRYYYLVSDRDVSFYDCYTIDTRGMTMENARNLAYELSGHTLDIVRHNEPKFTIEKSRDSRTEQMAIDFNDFNEINK